MQKKHQVGEQILLSRNYDRKLIGTNLRNHLGNNYHPKIIKADFIYRIFLIFIVIGSGPSSVK